MNCSQWQTIGNTWATLLFLLLASQHQPTAGDGWTTHSTPRTALCESKFSSTSIFSFFFFVFVRCVCQSFLVCLRPDTPLHRNLRPPPCFVLPHPCREQSRAPIRSVGHRRTSNVEGSCRVQRRKRFRHTTHNNTRTRRSQTDTTTQPPQQHRKPIIDLDPVVAP